jgi:DNA-binding transcriptional ArsR family regulator
MTSGKWGLLTNHALVLIHVTEHTRSTLRDIAGAVGITERAALSILRALEEDGIITRRKEGRRNVYTVDMDALMSHRSHGTYSIEQIAGALFALSGRVPGAILPPGLGADPSGGRAVAEAESIASTQDGNAR